MKSITIRLACFLLASVISLVAIVCLPALRQSLSQAAMIGARDSANFSQRMPRIAVALTSGPEGQTDTFQESITTKLKGGAEVVKVSSGDAASVAQQNECDYVLHTEYTITKGGGGLGKKIDVTDDVLGILKTGGLPIGRKTQKKVGDASKTTDTVRKVKNVLNIQPNDKVTLKHRLISLMTSREVTNAFSEIAESESQVVEKLSSAVANDVLVTAKVGGGGGNNYAATAKPKQTAPDADEGPKEAPRSEKSGPERKANSCAASAADVGDLNGLRLGMTEAQLKALVAPTSKLKPGAFTPNAAGVAEVTLTPRETRTPKNFVGYQTMAIKLVEGKVAMISIKYVESYDIEDFAGAAGEKLKLPDAWEIQSGEAIMKCQGFDLRLSSGEQTLTLTDTSAFEKKKAKPRI